ncbi:hypothetical protein FALBO_12537 [Fusarium albosuccineum]|uniref:Uncharacterized protein n=1 Tax=Fusarium albosuccineum TaxID=1237068 RepID=A0A8H4P318_9HYPO|nr:hypothetical protein FALBO_12537 [Fusarium albosuccineum]
MESEAKPPSPQPAEEEKPRNSWYSISETQGQLSDIIISLKQDFTLRGCSSLGKDGILRSLTADRQVVDAVPLSPQFIKALLDRMPFNPQHEIDFRGVDGRNTPREQWLHPDKSLLPPPLMLTDEERKLAESKVEENKKLVEERRSRSGCPPHLRSDHDLGLKGSSGEEK